MEEMAATGEQAAVSILEQRLYTEGITIKQETLDHLSEQIFIPYSDSSSSSTSSPLSGFYTTPSSASLKPGISRYSSPTSIHHQYSPPQQPSSLSLPRASYTYPGGPVKRAPRSPSSAVRKCQVCREPASGNFFGALVCLPCKTFFIRCTTEDVSTFKCRRTNDCEITGPNRSRCKYCRYRRCIDVGMIRKERPEHVEAVDGQQLCVVCRDIANGIHFGVVSCEGCKKFFRRGLQESDTYCCKYSQTCVINPKTRNDCRFCRFQKCLRAGMSRDAIKMGRPRKNMKELGMFDQHSAGMFNPLVKYMNQQNPDPLRSPKHPHYHPYDNSRMLSMFYQMQQQQQQQQQHQQQQQPRYHHHHQQQKVASGNERLPEQVGSSAVFPHPQPYLNRSVPQAQQQQNSLASRTPGYNSPKWVGRHVNTPGSLTSEASESSGNESGAEEQLAHYNNPDTAQAMDTTDSKHPLLILERKYGEHLDEEQLLPHFFKQEPLSPLAQDHTESQFTTASGPAHLGCTLSPPPSPTTSTAASSPPELLPIESLPMALDLSQDSPKSMEEPASSAPSSPSSPLSSEEDGSQEESDGFPSKHHQFMEHAFDSAYWHRSLEQTPRAELSDEHRSRLNTMVTAYLRFVEEFSRDDELKELRPLWKSKDAGEQTEVFQKQVIHQLATVISFVHVIPGFAHVNSEDKYTILRLGTIQMSTVVAAINLYNPLTHTFVKTFFEEELEEESLLYGFRASLLKLARAVHHLNLDSVEAACLLACLTVASDWPALLRPELLEAARAPLLEAFKAYTLDKYGPGSSRLENILNIVPQLRDLCLLHYKITFQLSFKE